RTWVVRPDGFFAILTGQFYGQLGRHTHVDIEEDAELVSTRLLVGQTRANLGGAIVEEILQMQRGAPAWRFMTVRRSGNRAAYYVARMALSNLPGVVEVDMTSWVGT
ncbi:hypothetical protein LINPERHAP1_LOCUS21207, partial [Linum perenne]